MNAKTYRQMAAEAAEKIREINPWDLPGLLEADKDVVLVDIREPGEFADLHISGSLSVPRGIMESAAEWDYTEIEPVLANARQKPARSGRLKVPAFRGRARGSGSRAVWTDEETR